MGIPTARERLEEIAADIQMECRLLYNPNADVAEARVLIEKLAEKIFYVIDEEMYRSPAIKRSRTTARYIDEALAREVWVWYKSHPKMLNRDIGTKFRIDGARISEILNGKRFPHLKEEFK